MAWVCIYLVTGLAIIMLEWPRCRDDLEEHGWLLVAFMALLWPLGVAALIARGSKETTDD